MTDIHIAHVTVDSADAGALAGFYAALLGSTVDPDPSPFFATVGRSAGARTPLMFIQVPDRTPGKNAIHLDLHTADRDAAVEHAVSLGAKHVADFDEYGTRWTTLTDPEGNLFDIAAG